MNDCKRQDMQENTHLHSEMTEKILGSYFDVMNELGTGFNIITSSFTRGKKSRLPSLLTNRLEIADLLSLPMFA